MIVSGSSDKDSAGSEPRGQFPLPISIGLHYNVPMKKVSRTFKTTLRDIFRRKAVRTVSDQDKLRQSARATLKKYHATFRRLANE